MTDVERAEHAARLRGLLYLACPEAAPDAITSTAAAIAENTGGTPREAVPPAAGLRESVPQGQVALFLSGADLSGADLTDADLTGADLTGADLTGADLTGADLTGADLTGARLDHAQHMTLPTGATWDLNTGWPENLAPVAAEQSDEVTPGVYRVRGEQAPHTDWTFLTNHARVLAAVADDPHTRIRDIAAQCRLTERAVQKIISDLEQDGYLSHVREGRTNTFRIKSQVPLRHPVEAEAGLPVATLLSMLVSHDAQRSSHAQPHQTTTGADQ